MSAAEEMPSGCPVPRVPEDFLSLAHGEGGRLTRRLIRKEILPVLGNSLLDTLGDGTKLPAIEGAIVMTTDSSVVSPISFPGGDIGSLAVHSAINDLAVCGADPLYLSLAFILEEGLSLTTFRRILRSIRSAADAANVAIVTGDTKVVPRGTADQIFINTTGIGRARPGVDLRPAHIRAGDRILVSGFLGDHGLAIMASRHGLDFEGLQSDSAPIHGLAASLLESGVELRFMRDPTRGGVAAVLFECLEELPLTVRLRAGEIPVSDAGRGACELLGLDPLFIANEGKLVAVVAEQDTDRALAVLRNHPLGKNARAIGWFDAEPTGLILVDGELGTSRVLDEPSGAPLPRIC